MGYLFHHFYIDDKEFPTLAAQKAQELVILAEVRQAQAERAESARREWIETQATLSQAPPYWRKRAQGIRREWIETARKQRITKPLCTRPVEQIKGEWVYFVLDPNIGLIKIGWSSQLEVRFRRLKLDYSKDLQFLGAFKGSRKDEAAMHKIFKLFKCNMKRYTEWFFDMEPLYTFIRHSAEVEKLSIDESVKVC